MPRWCLFGRTRELCDKLESTGKAGQVRFENNNYNSLLNRLLKFFLLDKFSSTLFTKLHTKESTRYHIE